MKFAVYRQRSEDKEAELAAIVNATSLIEAAIKYAKDQNLGEKLTFMRAATRPRRTIFLCAGWFLTVRKATPDEIQTFGAP